jgi:5-hydroxyisourate hydrolase
MAGDLTTHVLDLVHGRPAAGMRCQLWRLGPGRTLLCEATAERTLLCEATTNGDGRCPQPLLAGDGFQPGGYELLFFVGDYFREQGLSLARPAFLERVPIRFGIAEPNGRYHVPLLVTPWGYQTYRGS